MKRCGALPLRVAKLGISYSTTAPFQAVVINIENVPELQAFRDGLRRIAAAPPFEPPHISLLYTIDAAQQIVPWATDPPRLREIAADAARRVSESIPTVTLPMSAGSSGRGARRKNNQKIVT